jgi:hypothetical protein
LFEAFNVEAFNVEVFNVEVFNVEVFNKPLIVVFVLIIVPPEESRCN